MPTGLYYQPNSGLSKKGKVYQSKSNALTYFFGDFITVSIRPDKKIVKDNKSYFENHKAFGGHRQNTYHLPKIHFKIEEL